MAQQNRTDKSAVRLRTESKRVFQTASQRSGVPEVELASRILEQWAKSYLSGEAEVPPPTQNHSAPREP